jgi:hypothetical protein
MHATILSAMLCQAGEAAPRSSGGLLDALSRGNPDDLLALCVAGLAIVCVCAMMTAIAIAKLVMRHRERLALIEQGFDPDRKGVRLDGTKVPER